MSNLTNPHELDTLIGNSGPSCMDGTTTGGVLVEIVEEVRALGDRGFHANGDDALTDGELIRAAAAHVTAAFAASEDSEQRRDTMADAREAFPFHSSLFDFGTETETGELIIDPAKNLVRGIAYLIAEVQRIRRAEVKALTVPILLENAA